MLKQKSRVASIVGIRLVPVVDVHLPENYVVDPAISSSLGREVEFDRVHVYPDCRTGGGNPARHLLSYLAAPASQVYASHSGGKPRAPEKGLSVRPTIAG